MPAGRGGSTLSNGELGPSSRPGNTPEGRRSAPKPSLRSPTFRWTLFDGRPYPPDSFSWAAWRSGLSRSCPSRSPQSDDLSVRWGLVPRQ